MPELTVNIIDESEGRFNVDIDQIERVLGYCYDRNGEFPCATINLLLTTDENIAVMNSQYLNHEGPTDVLAFYDGDIEDEALNLGDIAVSVDTAMSMAAKKNMAFNEELTLYCLHGLLHLLGMEDSTDELRKQMIAAQMEIFSNFNLTYNV